MCHFVMAVLPKDTRVDDLDELASQHGRQFQPQANLSMEAALRPDERFFLTTLGHCDCGTALGERVREPRKTGDHDIAAKRLRARGWSETKVARWLAQKQQVNERNARVREGEDTGGLSDWVQFLQDVSQSKLTPYVGILLHWYGGPLSERIQLRGREVVRVADLTPETLAHIKEDVVYEFR